MEWGDVFKESVEDKRKDRLIGPELTELFELEVVEDEVGLVEVVEDEVGIDLERESQWVSDEGNWVPRKWLSNKIL